MNLISHEDRLTESKLKEIKMKSLHLTLFIILGLSLIPNAKAETFNQVYQEYISSQQTENHQQTVVLAEKSLALGKAKFGETNANTINLTYNLATAFAAADQNKKAFDTMEIVTSDFETRHGKHSEKLFTAILERLSYYPQRGELNLQERQEILKPLAYQAIDIADELTSQFPEKSPYIYFQLSRVITRNPIIYQVQRKAKKYAELAYEGMLKAVGKKDYRTIEAQFTLAMIKTGTQKNNRAIELYEDLIDNISNQLDTSHPYELAARSRLVSLYEAKGESDKATQHCIEIGKMKPWEDDLDPIPLFRVEPKYPTNLARKNKEGSVKMSFTIDEMGFVQDIEIIDIKGGKGFGTESVKVLQKWRYAPKFENGQVTVAKDLRVQLDFKMGKS